MTALWDGVFCVHGNFKSAAASRVLLGGPSRGIAGAQCATFSNATGSAGIRAGCVCRSRAVH